MQKQSINIRFFIFSTFVMVAFVVLFTLVYRSSLRGIQVLNPDEFVLQAPQNFDYVVNYEVQEEAIIISGYAIVLKETPAFVNNYVVLHSKIDDKYYTIPTSMNFGLDVQLPEDIGPYYYGKFSAIVLKESLDYDLQNYSVAFLYRTNGHNNLVLTNTVLA